MRGGLSVGAALWVTACIGARDARHLCDPTLADTPLGYTDADSPIPRQFLRSTSGTVAFVDNVPATNPITNAGAALGRVLFYDVRLSGNDSISCASCHQQKFGFGDTVRFSRGIHGRSGSRRTLALANARFNSAGRFFWDERAASLEEQVMQPVQDSVEMGMPVSNLGKKLSATSYYPGLFASAFGSTEITDQRIAQALAQFVRSLVSSRSRFDAVFARDGPPDYSVLNAAERDGALHFKKSGCTNCHRTIAQVADKPTNNGIDVVPADTGAGHGRFKPSSLRNVAVRPPYMHDGRFTTLRQVVEFYSSSVQDGPDLDPRLRDADGSPRRLRFTPQQVNAIVAFLESLTDSAFLRDDRFSNPFGCD